MPVRSISTTEAPRSANVAGNDLADLAGTRHASEHGDFSVERTIRCESART